MTHAGQFITRPPPALNEVSTAARYEPGPDRVMRSVLEALEAGPLSAPMLALTVGASEDNTRRALRTLHSQRAVVYFGFELGSGQRWAVIGTPAAEDLALLWSAERAAHLTRVLGPRFTQWARRALVAAL